MNYWLIKTEPVAYSIGDLRRDTRTAWEGVRNYQARNYMREMRVGDLALFYHSGADVIGAVGVAEVAAAAHADESQFDRKDPHYDAKATRERPVWFCPDVAYVETFKAPVTLAAIKSDKALGGIMVARQGSRLSVQPVSEKHFRRIRALGQG